MTGTIIVYSLMGLALLVGSLVSLSNEPSIRGWRNLAMLSILVLGIVSLFIVGWLIALSVWLGCAVMSALLYKIYDLIARAKATTTEDDPPQSFFLMLIHGVFVWPLIFLEGFEYLCTELFPSRFAASVEQGGTTEEEQSI